MYRRDREPGDGYHLSAEDRILVVRPPGGCRLTIPAGMHFFDLHLGRGSAAVDTPSKADRPKEADGDVSALKPRAFRYLAAADRERELRISRTRWSVQACLAPAPFDAATGRATRAAASVAEETDLEMTDETMLGIAQLMQGVWSTPRRDPDPALAGTIVEMMALRVSQLQLPSAPAPSRHATQIQGVLDHVETHYAQPLRLEDLASVAAMSPYHFARVFRQETGRSPHQYLVERRLAAARRLLRTTDEPIVRIAFDCGFGSQSHMTTLFGKHFQTTPGAVRRES